MESFIVDNYIWIVVICLFIIFTLIGYIADKSSKNKQNTKQKDNTNNNVKSKSEEVAKKESIEEEKKEEITKENLNSELPNQETKIEPTLDDLIKQNSSNTNYVQMPNEESDTSASLETNEEENNNEEKEETKKEVYNTWNPELEEENKSIITEASEEKEDSK